VTAAEGGNTPGSATLNINAVAVAVNPPGANVPLGGTQQFSATVSNAGNAAVTWSLSGSGAVGSIDSSGLYTAPSSGTTPITFSAVATSEADNSKSGSSGVTVPAVAVTVSPNSPVSLYAAESPNWPPSLTQQQFTASVSNAGNTSVTWAVNGGGANGTIDQTGLYSAPSSVPNPPTISINAASQADSSKSGSGTVQLLQPTGLGSFIVTVTATEGGVAHSQQVTLVVQ